MYYISAAVVLVLVALGLYAPFIIKRKRNEEQESLEFAIEVINVDDKQKYMKNLAQQHSLSSYKRCSAGIIRNSMRYWRNLRKNYQYLRQTPERLLSLVPSSQWIIDNYYVINRENRLLKESFISKSYKRLPCLKNGRLNGYPRIYSVAQEMLKLSDFHLEEDTIVALLNSYQEYKPITISELWAFNDVLKICLIEAINILSNHVVQSIKTKKQADEALDRILRNNSDYGKDIIRILEENSGVYDINTSNFIAQVLYRLKELGEEESSLKQFAGKDRDGSPIDVSNAIHVESQYQALLQVRISSAITSLIEVSAIDWEKLFLRISPVEAVLSNDASGVYPLMDFATRNEYHRRVEKLAGRLRVEEMAVAQKAVELSKSSRNKKAVSSHVGYYLLGKGQKTLEEAFNYNPDLFSALKIWIERNTGLLYFASVFVLSSLTFLLTLWYTYLRAGDEGSLVYLLFSLPFTAVVSLTIGLEVMNFVVTTCKKPVKLPSMDFENGIPEECSTMVVMPVIISSGKAAKEYLEKLETYYLANRHRNLYFALLGDFKDAVQREMPEDRDITDFTAEHVNRLNSKYGTESCKPFFYFHRYRKWNEKEGCWMGWERKRGKLEELNRLLQEQNDTSYNIIVGDKDVFKKIKYVITIDADTELTKGSAASLIGIMAHPLNRPVLNREKTKVVDGYALLQPKVGVRINYAMASFFSRIFSGQAGIEPYTNAASDVYQDAFNEGSFSGKGIYDVRVFHKVLGGRIPENAVLSHDLLEGCYSRCGLATGVELMDGYPSTVASFFRREHRWIRGDWQLLPWLFGRDSLSALSRWKIFDNLRRSVVPVSQLVITILAFSVLDWQFYFWVILILFSMFFSLAINVSNTTLFWIRKYGTNTYISNFMNSLMTILRQGVFLFILLPYRALISIDAIIRTLYRLVVSRKKLLEWQTAESVEKTVENSMVSYIKRMWIGPLMAVLIVLTGGTDDRYIITAIAALWAISPLASYYISLPRKDDGGKIPLDAEKVGEIRLIARKTWRYFEEFFCEKDNWLSPDNYQLSPENVFARRTSPTNIGLQLLSTLCARDLGYISLSELVDRLEKTLSTVNRLERWHGHLYNWYDTRSLKVLYPKYVSTVDSGNFVGYLVVLKNALEEIKAAPLFSRNQFEGLQDTVRLTNMDICLIMPSGVPGWRNLLKTLEESVSQEIKPWMDEEWMQLLRNMNKGFEKDMHMLLKSGDGLEDVPSLDDLCRMGNDEALTLASRIDRLVGIMEKIIGETDFVPLYDDRRELFRVGFNASLNSPDNSYYDLLASESRLTSFFAIAKGDVHKKHWFKLGRPMTLIHGTPTLISWSGTMFEYLLPNIIMKVYPGTILDQSCRSALKKQIEYGKVRRIPWGISESGYYHFDRNLNYQYKAFGVPGLGFKSDLRKSLVVAPYATLLAVQLDPQKAYSNIRVLKKMGAEGKYGFYEALDFMGNAVNKTGKFKLIKSFMIHHQGMSLAAVNNLINRNILQERFHREPMIRGTEFILEELQPYGVVIKNDDEKVSAGQTERISKENKEMRTVRTTKPRYPVAHILSNNSYSVMLTSSGGGVSTWNDISVNRWRPLPDETTGGIFFYIRDVQANKYWSAAYMPSYVEPEEYRVNFLHDKAEFIRKDGNIETKMEVVVSAKHNVEIRRITLYNRGEDTANIEVTSYFEPVIDAHENDAAHPAFSKLFISTEYLNDRGILLASRRSRHEKDKNRYVFNAVSVLGKMTGEIEYETDRYRFIGWGNTLRNPQALKSGLPLSNTAGNVLDPVMSMRVSLSISAGKPAVINYVFGISTSRDEAVELASIYQSSHAVDDVFKMALFDSEMEMQYLGINPQHVNSVQDLVGSIYYPSRLLRGPVDIIEKNRLGQSGLWKFGISGDYPIMVFRIKDLSSISFLKDAVAAYEYLRKKGVKLDFVILNEESEDYFQPLNHHINEIISNRRIYYPNSKNSGIYVLKARQMTQEEIHLIITAARVVLSEKNHMLSRRIKKLLTEECPEPERAYFASSSKVYEDIPLSDIELKFFNGVGGFSADGKEYVITLKNGYNPPGPWSNIMANESFGCIVTVSGSGYTWSLNSRENKLTTWSNDPVVDPPSEIVYIRDDATGELFCPTPSPIKHSGECRVRHGFGYTEFERNSHGIKQKVTVFISSRDPVKLYRVSLENASNENRELSLYFYAEWVMGVSREITAPYIITEMNEATNTFMARNSYNMEYNGRVAFISSSERITSYTGDKMEFIGRTGCAAMPAGALSRELSNRTGAAFDPCGAVKVSVRLKPGQSKEVVFTIGEAEDAETAQLLAEVYRRPRVAGVVLNRVKVSWKRILEKVQVRTPDEEMNILLNGWLLYQVLSCRIRARAAFFQCGGAYGFRDQLQDVMSLMHASPETAREQILRCCSRQFLQGDVQHWWHDDSGKGVRTRISDDLLWLPYVTAFYVAFTGDESVLDEIVPYIDDRELEPLESERYIIPEITGERESVYMHCIRAIERAYKLGKHGLPLIGAGDWNDGMNRVGWKGSGESVWLGWFIYKVLMDFAPVCRLKGDDSLAEKYINMAEELAKNIEANAWDGEWYVRAYFDSGEPLGSRQNTECRIDSIPQSWSIISGGADRERARKAMESVQKYLVKEEDRLIMLLTPPFDKSVPNPGYIRGYLPGIRENGGQYTHAAAWNVIAYAMLGNGDKAAALFSMLNPINHTKSYSDIVKYKLEPYVMSADVYSSFPHAGRGGWSWYTGSAGWMYQAGMYWILGIVRRGDMLLINPAIPASWKGFYVLYRHGDTKYHIEVKNPDGAGYGMTEIFEDGRRMENGIKLVDDGKEHRIEVIIRAREPAYIN